MVKFSIIGRLGWEMGCQLINAKLAIRTEEFGQDSSVGSEYIL
jgi:hypothetical protein